ncbi:glycosyl hydrolase 53 family protein [Arthrobacter sp. H14-L1]|uniref:glycosyl hydrolase 53 family protein n=1 Tax=Arthrobacter sp. H14-L1 TaxID=2996697 RepID=UPI0022709F14|nr:glycosyl hydrolase 53 family protein [Arthrobacter sp. H14-L1]MCY0905277.1 glycosyl hydrolase 53 family protein [Arthrobacter sp. H14-L1]
MSSLSVRGADISFTLQEVAIGTAVRDAAGVRPIEQLLASRGANTLRLRLWVNPLPGTSGLAETLVMARRARDAGLRIILSLHYSDTWADGKSQSMPKSWRMFDDAQLLSAVESYTRIVVGALDQQGTPADVVQTGNEISRGMLWPAGQVYRSDGELVCAFWRNWRRFHSAIWRTAQPARRSLNARLVGGVFRGHAVLANCSRSFCWSELD